jgi:hypothetical protein
MVGMVNATPATDPILVTSSGTGSTVAMNKAAKLKQVDISRISFIDTLRWMTTAASGDELTELLVNPLRPDRHEPCVLKRRAKQYDLMNRPRAELRKQLKQKSVAA